MLKTVEDLQRSNFLIHALGKVSAEVAKVSSPQQVLNTLRDEISKLDLNFIYLSNDADQNYSSVVYTSLNLDIIKPLEKIAGQNLIGFTIPRSEWPPIIDSLDPNYPLFVDDFAEAIRPAYAQFPDSLVTLGLKTLGITEEDSGIFNPITFTDQSSGIIVTWGKSLQEQDIQAFSIFGSQLGSSLEQAKLIEIENKQLEKLERSNALILALAKISAQASSSFIPIEFLHTLAAELKDLGLDYYLCIVDKDHKEAEIAYVSPEIKLLKKLEKMFNASVIGYNVPIESWPKEAAEALNSKSSVFVENFHLDAKELFNKFPSKMAELGLDIIGIDDSTSGIHVATELHNGTTAIFSVWGPNLVKSDLATFSIYASQISNSFEQARLIEAELKQTKSLRKSNTILEALSHVAAKVATSNDPDSILKTLGDELLVIGIECLVVLLDEESNEGYIRYHSMKSGLVKKANKISKTTFSTRRQPLADFPGEIRNIFDTNQPYYIDDFNELIKSFIGNSLPDSITNKVTGIVGINEETKGVFLPLSTSNIVFGCIALWDTQLRENDLSTFSVFSHQIAIAFQNASLLESERKQADELHLSNSHLKALGRIASRLSNNATKEELITILNEELKTLSLDFAYISVFPDSEKAIIDFISFDANILDKIKKITGITIPGKEVSQDYYPRDGIKSFRNNETLFINNLQEYLKDSFQYVSNTLISKAMKFAGIYDNTPGMFLPIRLGDGSASLIIIWGKSLREENLAAFRLYATQVESKLESARLYKIAQQEISDRKELEKQLTHEVVHDTLTALPNRLLFFDRLEHTIARSQRTKDFSYAVLFIDLDRFKDVNDNHGHLLGDDVLVEIAKRIQMCVRGSDTVARFGGDEFVILQENIKSPQDSSILCERILDHIEQPLIISKSEIKITASIGIVVGNPNYHNAEQYLRDADIAMYRSKELGKARYDYFNVDMRDAVVRRYHLEKDIRKALNNHQFFLMYQPIVSLVNKNITGLEALIRWKHPEQGLISPADFIPVAENIGVIHEIGQWVLEEACKTLHELHQSFKHEEKVTLNVNVSPLQLLRQGFPDEVKKIIQGNHIDPKYLALEITETAFIKDQKTAAKQIDILKNIGVQIHLDDFGTGYSSLSLINLFKIDCLKIEKQFISGMRNDNQRNLISAILALGEKLDLTVIAEGIEYEKQHNFLQEIGCVLGQGFYYSKPLIADKVPDWIQSLKN